MANKPDKFGIKFWLCVDVEKKYLLNAFPYLGKDENRPQNQSLGEHVVMRLMEPFLNKGRNVTTDNFFTSVALARNLLSKHTTLVGTVNKARRDFPPYAKNIKMQLYNTAVLTTDKKDCLLTIYQTKKHKNVSLLSTLHNSVKIDEQNKKKKPDTVLFYNSTKYGVDVIDSMAKKYSVKASSRRWPVQVFYNILDLAAINAWVLYQDVNGKKVRRRQFILQLAEGLSKCLQDEEPTGSSLMSSAESRKRRNCFMNNCKNKTFKMCDVCKRPLCGKCNISKQFLCQNCQDKYSLNI